MNYRGYAFTEGWEEEAARIRARFDEIKHLRGRLGIEKRPGYAHTKFSGSLPAGDAEVAALSEEDLLIIADDGNLCFGGSCFRSNGEFSGRYNTD